MSDEYERAREQALRILERRRRTRKDVATRLREKGFGEEAVERVCDRLVELRLLDDREYARLYLKSRQGKPRGSRLLLRELQAKGVPQVLAEEVLADFEAVEPPDGDSSAEELRAMELARHSLGKVAGLPEREARNKLYQILARRGFNSDTIGVAVRQALATNFDSEAPDDSDD